PRNCSRTPAYVEKGRPSQSPSRPPLLRPQGADGGAPAAPEPDGRQGGRRGRPGGLRLRPCSLRRPRAAPAPRRLKRAGPFRPPQPVHRSLPGGLSFGHRMTTVPGMATTTTTVENEPASRIVEQRKTSPCSIASPVAPGIVVVVALLAWFAAKWSQSSQALTVAQQDAQQQRLALGQLQQRTSQFEGDLTRLRDPGRTTILLQPAATKSKKGAPSSA